MACASQPLLAPQLFPVETVAADRKMARPVLQVRQYLMEARKLQDVKQVVVNLSEEALWNLLSSSSNIREHAWRCMPLCSLLSFLVMVWNADRLVYST